MDIQQFKENPSLEELDRFTRKELFEVATVFEIKLTSLALRKKQLRDEIVMHLVNNELLEEDALETIQNENDGSVANSNFEIQLKIKQMELETKERMEERRLQMEERLEKEKLDREL